MGEQALASFQTPPVFLLLTGVVGSSRLGRSGVSGCRQMIELRRLLQSPPVRLAVVARSLYGLRERVAADRSWVVDAATNLGHLVHPSEGCDCSRAETLICSPRRHRAATAFSPGASSLVNISEVVTLGDFKSIREWGWTEIKPSHTLEKVLPKVLA